MKPPKSNNDVLGLGYTSTKEGETSKDVNQRSDKGKDSKPTCHYYNTKGAYD